MDPRLSALARRLEAPHRRTTPADAEFRQAAVACILSESGERLSVLLMRRAERAGDRWSGQVSFPGGHAEPEDSDLAATACRETLEEVGVKLDPGALLGCLPSRRAKARGAPVATLITPFVFALEEPPEPRLGPEATRAFWLPLARAAAGELDAEHRLDTGSEVLTLSAWSYAGETVWGMTHQMLRELLALIGAGE